MVLVSQSATVRSLRMRHDAMPRRYLQTLGLLLSLTRVQVRHRALDFCLTSKSCAE